LGLAPPANHIACPPLSIRDNLIIPSSEGPIVRINPRTGQMVGTPFMPPIAAGKKTIWFEPVLLDNDQFAIANGTSEGSESKLYLVSAANPDSLTEANSIRAPFPFKSRVVNIGELVFAAIEGPVADQMIAVQSSDFSIQNQVELPGRVVAGPWVVGDGIYAKMDDDQLVKLNSSLAQVWKLSIPNERLAGIPEQIDNQLVVGFQSGQLLFVDPTTGTVNTWISLRQPISSMPTRIGANWYCSGLDGTVHQIELSNRSGVN
jgi:outer membrane protein assembly factor BamB